MLEANRPKAHRHRLKGHRHKHNWSDHISALLQATGLTILYTPLAKVFGWQHEKEEKKIVMDKNRTVAILRCTVHIIPVGAALALLAVNASNYYIGGELAGPSGEDFQKLAALQFAAKLHELFMLTSLGTLLITYIRRELAFGEGLPFGAIFSGLQFREISFLWSPEMWGTIYNEWEKRSTKWFIILLMTTCTILGVSVGPSTANLMKPRIDDWPAGGTPFWINSTQDTLFAEVMSDSPALSHCSVDNSDLACPSGGWQVISQEYLSFWPRLVDMGSLPQVIDISSPFSVRSFVMRSRNTLDDTMMFWGNAFTMATTPISSVADSLAELAKLWCDAAVNGNIGRFKYRRDATFTVNAFQPLVLARCQESLAIPNTSVSLSFPGLGNVSLSEGPGTADQLENVAQISDYIPFNDSNTTNTVQSFLQPGMPPSMVWIDESTLLQKSNSTLAAVFTLPDSNEGFSFYYCCSIDSRLANVNLDTKRSVIKYVEGQPNAFDQYGTFYPEYPKIMIEAEWAKYLSPTIPGTNYSILSTIASTAGIWNTSLPSKGYYYEIIVENIIATLVANGIGRASYNTTMLMNLKGVTNPNDLWEGGDWISEILPKGGKMGPGGNAFDISAAEQNRSTMLQMVATVNGYAYSSQGIIQKVEMLVLGFYILLALCHVCYSVYTGLSSSTWGSAPEVTTLAMNSSYTQELQNTGAGIQTVEVFKNRVKVEEKEERLQMTFNSNERSSDGCRVEENVSYS